MKLRNLFFASLAIVTFAACSNDDEPGMPDKASLDAAPVDINVITKAAPATKATQIGVGNESNVTALTIYVFNKDDGSYLAQKKVDLATGTSNTTPGEKSYSATITGLKQTTYTFVAIASPHYTVTPAKNSNFTTFMNAMQKYEDQFGQNAGFVMSGQAEKTLTEDSTTLSIDLKRCLAAIELGNVKTNFDTNVPENFKAATATLQAVYLVNVKRYSYTDETGERKSIEITSGEEAKLYHGSSDTEVYGKAHTETYKQDLSKVWTANFPELTASDNSINTRLYAFPTKLQNTNNTNETNKVMLKLKVKYDFQVPEKETGVTTATRYYTITVNNSEINRNTLYKLSATITGLGSKDDSTIEETAGNVTVTLNVLPWTVIEQNEGNLTD